MLCVVVAAVVATPSRASAHTELDVAVPGPGASVGGTVDWIELNYFGPSVSEPTVTVRGPGEITVPGEVVDVTDASVTYEMDALEVEGQYIVEWQVTAFDGVAAESAYAFTFDEDSPPLERPPLDVSWQGWIIGLTAAFALAFGFLLLVRRAQQQRTSVN